MIRKTTLFIIILSCIFSVASCKTISKNYDTAETVKEFYSLMEDLYKEYYSTNIITPYTEFAISESLKARMEDVFCEKSIYMKIIDDLHPLYSQQFDKFLLMITSLKNKTFYTEKTGDEITVTVKTTACHSFYSLNKDTDFKYYDDISIIEKEFEKLYAEAFKSYEEIGEGKFPGIAIQTEEKHVFTLSKKDGRYKIKNFSFNIESFSEVKI